MKILLIEDNPGDVRLVREILGSSGDFTVVAKERLETGLKYLASRDTDIVLLDLGLPDSSGMKTLTSFHHEYPKLPVIIMTSIDDEELGAKAVQNGAQDYIVKGQFDDRLFRRSMLYAIERKKAEQLKDDFIGMVSHEIKSPLTVILGALHTAKTPGISKKEARELINDAISGAESLSNIVDNLLELSRSQANRLVLHPEPLNIKQIAGDVLKQLHNGSPKHHLLNDIPDDLPAITGDSTRISRVLFNLVENAVKYSPEGGEIKITASQKEHDLVICVADKGPGISKEDQKKLFHSFEQLGRNSENSMQGVGLGLKVCRTLVEAHGGHIWVDSQPGEGSVFCFTLPMVNNIEQARLKETVN